MLFKIFLLLSSGIYLHSLLTSDPLFLLLSLGILLSSNLSYPNPGPSILQFLYLYIYTFTPFKNGLEAIYKKNTKKRSETTKTEYKTLQTKHEVLMSALLKARQEACSACWLLLIVCRHKVAAHQKLVLDPEL